VESNPVFDEKVVIQAVLDGQSWRFGELVVAYQERLTIGLYAMLGNRHDAEDVAQDAFTTAYQKLRSYECRSSFFTWLHRIAFNQAIDHKRREKRHRRTTFESDRGVDLSEDLMKTSSSDSPVTILEREEIRLSIHQALAQIDAERRAVITLRDLQGLNYEEISECLSIPVGTVRSRLHRARLELKEVLLSRGEWSESQ